jgi:hypothetical protein
VRCRKLWTRVSTAIMVPPTSAQPLRSHPAPRSRVDRVIAQNLVRDAVDVPHGRQDGLAQPGEPVRGSRVVGLGDDHSLSRLIPLKTREASVRQLVR